MFLISSKHKVKDSGILQDFCECHCHLLPGVDDGVKKTKDTLAILHLWEEAGVSQVWLTPHIMEDMPNQTDKLRERFDKLKKEYEGNIKLTLASENMMDKLFDKRMEDNQLLPLGESGEFLLVETSYVSPPVRMEEILYKVRAKGFKPVLAHPERYRYMTMDDFIQWKEKNVLFQLNMPSLTGMYGDSAKKNAKMLLKHGMYDFCGTDTHTLRSADFFLNYKIKKKTIQALRKLSENNNVFKS